MMEGDYKTQEKKVVEQLNLNGRVTRNWALQNYITRLGAIIWSLKQDGWDISARYERTLGGYGRKRDYVYLVVKK